MGLERLRCRSSRGSARMRSSAPTRRRSQSPSSAQSSASPNVAVGAGLGRSVSTSSIRRRSIWTSTAVRPACVTIVRDAPLGDRRSVPPAPGRSHSENEPAIKPASLPDPAANDPKWSPKSAATHSNPALVTAGKSCSAAARFAAGLLHHEFCVRPTATSYVPVQRNGRVRARTRPGRSLQRPHASSTLARRRGHQEDAAQDAFFALIVSLIRTSSRIRSLGIPA
jgi:hypothetical protein